MKILHYISILVLLSCCRPVARHITKTNSKIIDLPAFQILSPDSAKCISSKYLPAGRPYIFVYFSPDCDHCQQEINSILKHIDRFNDLTIFLISSNSLTDIAKFYNDNNLMKYNNIEVGQDYEYTFYRNFIPSQVPYIAIYDTTKKLVKTFVGETDIRFLLTASFPISYKNLYIWHLIS